MIDDVLADMLRADVQPPPLNRTEIDMGTRKGSPVVGDPGPPPFKLWREVLVAYLAPALMAGAGGVAGGQPDLVIAACTSIAGTSAVVATLIGTWLQRRGIRRAWLTSMPRIVPTALLAIGAAVLGGLLAWLVTDWVPDGVIGHHGSWPDRLRLDLPLSSALAVGIITWRWRGSRHGRPQSAPHLHEHTPRRNHDRRTTRRAQR
ncbi:hypothetical protein [Streptomyces sp. NPDC048473]|uniref:hypothetical protein n=1 Tax=unclassified Streptomyces TaxID=2593676 RepID=UPI003711DFE5